MFEFDICLCRENNCPFKNKCVRGQSYGPGIYTMSNFYIEEYKKPEDCNYFILKKENGGLIC